MLRERGLQRVNGGELPRPSLYRAEAVKRGEALAAKQANIPLYTLMERAGQSLFQLIIQTLPEARRVLICCGTGNNGGDGYTLARLLKAQGLSITLWSIGDSLKIRGDAALARSEWFKSGGLEEEGEIISSDFDLIIDALLGTGLRGEVRPRYLSLVHQINESAVPVLSVDIPSGLCANTGQVLGNAVQARYTLTFVGLKIGLTTGKARDYIGELWRAELGIGEIFAQIEPSNIQLMTTANMRSQLPLRAPTAHKGSAGRVLCIGGDLGMGGALSLSCEAVARSGAGLIKALTHPEHIAPLLSRIPEVMTVRPSEDGEVERHSLSWADVVVVGPGLGQSTWGIERLSRLYRSRMKDFRAGLVLDADCLNLIALWMDSPDHSPDDLIVHLTQGNIITPHPGEAARLLNWTIDAVEEDRVLSAHALSQRFQCVTVLKGAGTIVTDGAETWICPLGNSGMASGGMGDVLSGVIGGLLAQRVAPLHAACLGVWLHSKAADLALNHLDPLSLLATDVIKSLTTALRELRNR